MTAQPKRRPPIMAPTMWRIPAWWPNLPELAAAVRAGAIEAGAVPDSIVVTFTPLDARQASVTLEARRIGGGPPVATGSRFTNEATAEHAREAGHRWMDPPA